jgi:transcriptional regulator with XRE-family HTH domain
MELSFLGFDTPTQVYQNLINDQPLSQEQLAEALGVADDGSLRRIKRGESIPPFRLLLKLKPPNARHRLLAGVGFVDQLLRSLGLQKSVLRHEFLPPRARSSEFTLRLWRLLLVRFP